MIALPNVIQRIYMSAWIAKFLIYIIKAILYMHYQCIDSHAISKKVIVMFVVAIYWIAK